MSTLDLGLETERLLKWLGQFGGEEGGGVSRLLYTPEWLQAQQGLAQLMRQKGWAVRFDAVGTLFGRLEGTEYRDETILTGSHADTVRRGGIYDGQYGIIAAILALQQLQAKHGAPLRNIEIVSFAEEESSRFPYAFWGSKNLLALAGRSDVEHLADSAGVSFVDAMEQSGFDFRNESEPIRTDIKAFLEAHIEQGGVLEAEQKSIGVVTDIVGQRRYIIEVVGEANHAGTTPMGYRKDALYAAGTMICASIDLAKSYGDPLVATVGRIDASPNVSNVVPGKTVFTLDTRHTDSGILYAYTEEAISQIKNLAAKLKVEVGISMWMDAAPIPMNQRLVELLVSQCRKNGTNFKKMHSGAGHDSQIMAPYVPTAMLFVPSRRGISHSPQEYTAPQDLGAGVEALSGALYELAYVRQPL